jgi:hypothetical protein
METTVICYSVCPFLNIKKLAETIFKKIGTDRQVCVKKSMLDLTNIHKMFYR